MVKPLLVVFLATSFISLSKANDTVPSHFVDSVLDIIVYETDYPKKVDYYFEIIDYYEDKDLAKSLEYCISAIQIAASNQLPKKEIHLLIKKVRLLCLLGKFDPVSEVLFELEKLVKKQDDPNLNGQLFLAKGFAYSFTSDYVSAMENSLKAISLLEKTNDSLNLAKTYNVIGVIYDITGNSQKALENYLLSLNYAEKLNNISLLGGLNNNIGIIYDLLNDKENALVYYYKSLEYYNKSENRVGIANAFSNIASLLADQKRYDEAIIYSRKAEKINQETHTPVNNALIYKTLGYIYLDLQKKDSAFFYFNKCLMLYNESNYTYGTAHAYSYLGDFFFENKNYKTAISYFKKSLNIAGTNQLFDLQENSLINLSNLYAITGNYKKAYHIQNEIIAITDSVREENRKEEIKHSELQIEFRNQINQHNEELNRYEKAHDAEIKKQTIERIVLFTFIIIILVIAFFLYRSTKKLHRFNHKLLVQNREIEDQKELIEISNIELKEQYTFTETLLNTIPNPVFYTDKNSVLLGCNNAFEEITGKDVDYLIGINLAETNLRTNLTCDSSKLFGNPGKGLIRNEGSMIYSNGGEHDVICYRKGIVNSKNKLLGILGIIIDVTDIRKVEKDLKHSQVRLKEAINAKDKFFNIMAHDLKNPFNAILGLTNVITDDYDSHSKDEIKQYIKLINQSATHIYNLLENLLEWARAQSGAIDKSPLLFPVNEVIQECINLFHQNIKQKSISLNFDASKDFTVFADKNMTMTVIRNLISNAIKFSNIEGSIDIDINKNADKLDIHIKDYGVGIAANNLDKLFKIDKPVTTPGVLKEKGTRLGLIICKEFVKINNGSLLVNSQVNKGTTFTITLPTTIS